MTFWRPVICDGGASEGVRCSSPLPVSFWPSRPRPNSRPEALRVFSGADMAERVGDGTSGGGTLRRKSAIDCNGAELGQPLPLCSQSHRDESRTWVAVRFAFAPSPNRTALPGLLPSSLPLSPSEKSLPVLVSTLRRLTGRRPAPPPPTPPVVTGRRRSGRLAFSVGAVVGCEAGDGGRPASGKNSGGTVDDGSEVVC